MLNSLIPYALAVRERWPRVFGFLVATARRYFPQRFGIYPRPLADEVKAAAGVIRGAQWNMTYGKGLEHEHLEAEFAEYVGVNHAVAVNTGGMALQMSLRALGLRPGDEVVHQIDTCSATAMAVMNAGCTPIFADVSTDTFLLSMDSVRAQSSRATKALIATHLWGNVEDVAACRMLADELGMRVVEDACLALGAKRGGKVVGSFGDVGVFSFGSLKPIQGGEGGMIVTNDESLARELRSMRHWGDRTAEFGSRDALYLSWNGRMSEIVAAVVRQQLKGYPNHLQQLREAVARFEMFVSRIDGLDLVYGAERDLMNASFTQVVVRLDEGRFGWKKTELLKELYGRGVQVRHANFEPINSLGFFKERNWRDWILRGDIERVAANFAANYPGSQAIYDSIGLGLGNINFLSSGNLNYMMRQIEALARRVP